MKENFPSKSFKDFIKSLAAVTFSLKNVMISMVMALVITFVLSFFMNVTELVVPVFVAFFALALVVVSPAPKAIAKIATVVIGIILFIGFGFSWNLAGRIALPALIIFVILKFLASKKRLLKVIAIALIIALILGFVFNWKPRKDNSPVIDNQVIQQEDNTQEDESTQEDNTQENGNKEENDKNEEDNKVATNDAGKMTVHSNRPERPTHKATGTVTFDNVGGSDSKNSQPPVEAKTSGSDYSHYVDKRKNNTQKPATVADNATKENLTDGVVIYYEKDNTTNDNTTTTAADKGETANDEWLNQMIPQKKSDKDLSEDATKENTKSDETKSDNTTKENTKSDETKSDNTTKENTKSDETKSDNTTKENTKSDETKSDNTTKENTKSDETKSDNTTKESKTSAKPSIKAIDGDKAYAGDTVQFKLENAKSVSGLDGFDYTYSNGVISVQTKSGVATSISPIAHGEDGSTATTTVTVDSLSF